MKFEIDIYEQKAQRKYQMSSQSIVTKLKVEHPSSDESSCEGEVSPKVSFSKAFSKILEINDVEEGEYLELVEVLLQPNNFTFLWDSSPITPKTHEFFMDYFEKNSNKINVGGFSYQQMKRLLFETPKNDENTKFLKILAWIKDVRYPRDAKELFERLSLEKISSDTLLQGLSTLNSEDAWECIKLLSPSKSFTEFAIGNPGEGYRGYEPVSIEDVSRPEFMTDFNLCLNRQGGFLALTDIKSDYYSNYVGVLVDDKPLVVSDKVAYNSPCCVPVAENIKMGSICRIRTHHDTNTVKHIERVSVGGVVKATPKQSFVLFKRT